MSSYIAFLSGVGLIYIGLKVMNGPPQDIEDKNLPSKFNKGKPHAKYPEEINNYIGVSPHEHGQTQLCHMYQPLIDRDGKLKNFVNDDRNPGVKVDRGDMRAMYGLKLAGKGHVTMNPNNSLESRVHIWHKAQLNTPNNNNNHVLKKVHQAKLFKMMGRKKWDIVE